MVLQQRAPGRGNIYSFCENLNKIFAKFPGFEPIQTGSQIFSLMLCPLSYWSCGVNNCLINQFMAEFNLVKNVVILCTLKPLNQE